MPGLNDFYVYIIYRPDGITPCYVGKGRGRRINGHFRGSHNVRLNDLIKENEGKLPFRKVSEGLLEIDAFSQEVVLITQFGRLVDGGILFNISPGGGGVVALGSYLGPRSKEWKENISSALKGRRHTPERIQAIRLSKIGTSASDETKILMSLSRKGKKRSPDAIEKTRRSHIGRKRSVETCQKIREANIGRFPSQEARAKMSAAQRGRKMSPESTTKRVEKYIATMKAKREAHASQDP